MSLLPENEYHRLTKIVYNGLANGIDLLTDFDLTFLGDFETRLDKYKRHTYVSDKQADQFDRIEKYLREGLQDRYED